MSVDEVNERRWLIEDVTPRYSEPHRKYHDVNHLHDVMDNVDRICDRLGLSMTIRSRCWRAAAWHDAVYIPGSKTNEKDSVALYKRNDAEVKAAILGTRDHLSPTDMVQAVLFDADLLGLGTNYDENRELVRAEFAHVSDEDWAAGRRLFLEAYLNRPSVFYTSYGAQYEHEARFNMRSELEALNNAS